MLTSKPPVFELENKLATTIPLEEAVTSHQVKLEPYFGKIVDSSKNEWVTLNQSDWKTGAFIYVPRNINAGTITIRHQLENGSSHYVPRIFVLVESGASVKILDLYSSQDASKRVVASVAEIVADENSEVQYVQIQELGVETDHYFTGKIAAKRDARVSAISCMFGGHKTVNHIHTSLQGQGSQAQIFGLAFGKENQVFEHYTLQEHLAPQTESDLLLKVALQDKAYSKFDGLIWIEKGAHKSSAYQQNRNLLLSENAKADSTPRLEILDDDVRCTHGAAIGPVDAEQLFYLESRGVSPKEAQALLVEGFFEQVLSRIPSEVIKQQLHHKLSQQLELTRIAELV